jgi:hypothetical protein
LIGKQFKNQSFRSTLDYVLGKEKAELIDSNMGGITPRQLAKEFGASRRLRPNLKRACGHIILSIPHRSADHPQGEYHEHLDDEQYVAIAHRWLKEMKFLGEGLNKSQYVIARHHDTDHEHIHIIASRIRMDSSVVSDSWDYRRSEVVVRQLEKEFGLEAAPCSSHRVATRVKEELGIEPTVSHRAAQTQKQKHHTSLKPPVTQMLADAIDAATVDSPTVTQLIGRLQQQGVVVHPQFSTQGKFKEAMGEARPSGIAFEMDGVKVAGWKLGKAYSFPGLQSWRGVNYDSERDRRALQAAAAGQLVELPTEQLLVKMEAAGLNASGDVTSTTSSTNCLDTQTTEVAANTSTLLPDSEPEHLHEISIANVEHQQDVSGKLSEPPALRNTTDEEQQLRAAELLKIAVPVGVEFINRLYKTTGQTSYRFQHAILEKQDSELVFTHFERGELFRVEIKRTNSGQLTYEPVRVGFVSVEDIERWQKMQKLLEVERMHHQRQEQQMELD